MWIALAIGAVISAFITSTSTCFLTCISCFKKQDDELENLNTNIKNVGDEVIKLSRKRFNVERRVNTANHGKNEVTKGPSEEWRDWCGRADKKIVEWKKLMSEYEEAKKSCCKMRLCLSSTQLVEKMKNIEKKMKDLSKEMDVNTALIDINTSTLSENRPVENRSDLLWLDENVEKILKLLKTSNKIVVHGEPNIGKTMILKALEEKAKKDCSFEEVIFVTMKEGEEEEQIRQSIAKQVKISIEMVSQVLQSEEYLLILDQVSKHIELNMLAGSPWKVLVATRYTSVCHKMPPECCHKIERMDNKNAQRFFFQQIKNGSLLLGESKYKSASSAAKIVKECGNLPQLIKVAAAYLQKYACDWEEFGRELMLPNVKKNESVNDAYKTLEVVLKKMGDDKEKCYVHASLFPPEKDIFKDYLIECWRAHECIASDAENNLGHPLRTSRLKGHDIIQDLLKGCFLIEGGDENCVKIPNICRDWVFETKEHGVYLVGNSQMKPDDVANAIHISSMENNTGIPIEGLNYKSIRTMLWRHQDEVSSIINKISNCESLRVLDLSHTNIDGLHAKIFELEKLKALYLNDCKRLMMLPLDIGTPNTSLEILDICRSGIQAMPMRIAKLHGLKCLRVSLTILRSYGKKTRIIGGLTLLEEFTAVKDGNLEENWEGLASAIEDLARLESLNVLCITFPNASGLEDFVSKSKSLKRKDNLWGEKIFRSFRLLVDCPKEHHEVFIPQPTEFHLRIFKESSNRSLKVFSKVMKQTTSLELINHNTIEYLSTFGMDNIMELKVCVISGCEKMKSIIRCRGNFNALTTLRIKNCSGLKVIFPAEVVEQIPSLKYLKVEKCQNTSTVFGEDGRSPTIVEVPLLESMELIDLQSLHSICSKDLLLVCLSLREMTVLSCKSFEDSSLDKICTKSDVQLKCEEDLKKKLESKETYFKCHPIPAFQPESYDGGKKVVGSSTKGKAKLVAEGEQHVTRQNRRQSLPSRTVRLEMAKVDTEVEPLVTYQNQQQQQGEDSRRIFEKGESSKQNDYNHSPDSTESERKGEVSPAGSLTTPSEATRSDSHISGNAQSTKPQDDSESNDHDHEGESSKQNDYKHSPEAPKSEKKDEIFDQTSPSEFTSVDSHISENAQSTKLSDKFDSHVQDHEGESIKNNDYNHSPGATKSERKEEVSPAGRLYQRLLGWILTFPGMLSLQSSATTPNSHVHDHEATDNVPKPLQLVALKSAYESFLKVSDNLTRSANSIDDDPEILEETREHLCNLAGFIDISPHKETLSWLIFVLNDVKIKNKNSANVLAKYRDLKLKPAEALASKSYSETKQKELGTSQVEDLPGKLSINRDRWEKDAQKYEDEMRKLEEAVKIAEEEQKQMKETLKDMAKSLEVEALVTYIEQEVRKFNV